MDNNSLIYIEPGSRASPGMDWDPFSIFSKKEALEPQQRCLLRVKNDLMSMVSEPPPGIFVVPDESDMTLVHALIIGTEGTPYEGGFFYFVLRFPPEYPFVPPKVKLMTTGDLKISFHPKLLKSGKVCLSTLTTLDWPSPRSDWTPAQTLKSVLISIQSCFTNNPYRTTAPYPACNELYNDFIQHETLRVAVIGMIKNGRNLNIPQPIYEAMEKAFIVFYDVYEEIANKKLHLSGHSMTLPYPSIQRTVRRFTKIPDSRFVYVDRRDVDIDRRDADIDRRDADIDRRDADIGRRGADIDRRDADIDRRDADIDRRDADIGRREADIDRREADIDRREADIDRREADIDRREADIDRREADIDRRMFNVEVRVSTNIPRPTPSMNAPTPSMNHGIFSNMMKNLQKYDDVKYENDALINIMFRVPPRMNRDKPKPTPTSVVLVPVTFQYSTILDHLKGIQLKLINKLSDEGTSTSSADEGTSTSSADDGTSTSSADEGTSTSSADEGTSKSSADEIENQGS